MHASFLANFLFLNEDYSFAFFLVRRGMEANQVLRAGFSSALSAALENADLANKDIISSVDC